VLSAADGVSQRIAGEGGGRSSVDRRAEHWSALRRWDQARWRGGRYAWGALDPPGSV